MSKSDSRLFRAKYILIHYFRKFRLFFLVSADVILMAASITLAALLLMQNDFSSALYLFKTFWWILPFSIAIKIGVFRNFGLYHWAWQYMSVKEVISLIKAISLSALLMVVGVIAFGQRNFPFSLIVLDGLITFALLGSSRLMIRIIKEKMINVGFAGESKRVLIVGAGDAGEMILREMLKINQLNYKPIGFADDSKAKAGTLIHHLPILGTCEEIPVIVAEHLIDEVIIALPSASQKQIRRIVNYCEMSTAKFKILPGMFELIDGTVHVSQIRNVEIEDLLGREPVNLDTQGISTFISGLTVMVTGAGGSIGSELCRQMAIYSLEKLILVGKGENSIFEIENELRAKYPFLRVVSYIGDIKDRERMDSIFSAQKPDIVFHAAAHKHVTLMEDNADEAILNNVIGTRNIVDLADLYGVKSFVMISTDKAVNPSNVMGATKRIAEKIVQTKTLSGSKTKLVSVRFGNVLGSRGSVIPIFKRQIANGGPVTVTHPETTRYFMTIPEASQLVIQAAAMGNGGEIFVLDMGEPVKIIDLAKDLIRLSGFEEGVDIEIKIVGLKPGEKLFEELFMKEEGMKASKHKKIMIAAQKNFSVQKLESDIKTLHELARAGKKNEIKIKLKEVFPSIPDNTV